MQQTGRRVNAPSQELVDWPCPSEEEQSHAFQLGELHLSNGHGPGQLPDLPPVDGGRDAWLFLVATFLTEALVYGFPFSFGIFEKYYSNNPPFSEAPEGIAVIGTTGLGILYCSLPLYNIAELHYPSIKVWGPRLGLVIIVIALVSSSFATTVWQLILTQGVLYAMGGMILYGPAITLVDEWFISKKGLAYGIMWAGTGTAGATIPFILSWCLQRYGFRSALRIWAVIMVVLLAPLLYFLKPRIPVSASHVARRVNFGFLGSRVFLVYQIGNILEGLGFFAPSIYLPSFAAGLGLSDKIGSAAPAILNATSVIGCIGAGWLTDRVHVSSVILVSAVGSTISVCLLWGLCTTLPLLILFCITYGLFAGSFSTSYAGIMKDVKQNDNTADPRFILGFLSVGRGIGNIAFGPVSEALLREKSLSGHASGAYGTGYGPLIIFTGITAALSGVSFAAKKTHII